MIDKPILNKKTFLPTVCVVYTILSIAKIAIEAVLQKEYGSYPQNLTVMLLLSFFATFVLSQHYRLSRFPLLLVIIGQYLVLLASTMFILWLFNLNSEIHPNGYRDMFRSFTIPYVIGAVIYYIDVFLEVRKVNSILKTFKKEGNS